MFAKYLDRRLLGRRDQTRPAVAATSGAYSPSPGRTGSGSASCPEVALGGRDEYRL